MREAFAPFEVVQEVGETVYVPAGCPHVVLNLDLTLALTHNFASARGPHFESMVKDLAATEPEFSRTWRAALRRLRPALADRADEVRVPLAPEDS